MNVEYYIDKAVINQKLPDELYCRAQDGWRAISLTPVEFVTSTPGKGSTVERTTMMPTVWHVVYMRGVK